MASFSEGSSYGYSTTTPTVTQTPQSEWGLDLSKMLATLGQSQYNWARGEYNRGMAFTQDNIGRYLQTAGQASELATNLLGRYKDVFEPIMNKFVEQAGSYNSEARQRFNMGAAESTASQAMQAGSDEAERKLQSFGIDPSSGRYQDQILASRIQRAAAMAGAGTQASVNTANTGRQMTQAAAQMGQNVPGMTVNALGAGVNALTGAQGAMQGMLQTGAALTSSAAPFFNAAGAANHLPPVSNSTQGKNRSQNMNSSVEPSRDSGNSGNGGQRQSPQPSDSGGRQSPQPSREPGNSGNGGQRQSPERDNAGSKDRPMGINNTQPGNKTTNLDDGSDIAPWQNGQDEAGNPIYDPAAWDYLNQPENQQGKTPWNEGQFGQDWFNNDTIATGQDLANGGTGRPDANFENAPTIEDGNIYNGRSMGTSDYQTPAYDATQRNQEVPFYSADTPSVNQDNPWQGVGNPLDDEFTGSTPQTNDYNYGDQGNYGGDQGNYGGDQTWDTTDPLGGYSADDEEWNRRNQGGGGSYDGGGYSGGYAKGGRVGRGVLPTMSPSRGRQTDDVPARLNVGEFVMPKDVVSHMGTKHFEDIIKKSRMLRTGQEGPAPKPKMKPALRMRPQFVSSRA